MLGTRVQTTSRCDDGGGDGGAALEWVARDGSIHCGRSTPGLQLARRSSSSIRNRSRKIKRERRRLRLCLWLQPWRLIGFSEEMVASPFE